MRHDRRAALFHAGQQFRLLRVGECHAADLLEFLERRQLAQVLEAELDQKFLGGLVEDRLADDVLAPGCRDQLAVEQRLQHAGALHAADLHDLGRGDGLLVGDHGQGFQRRQRKLERRLEALDEAADGLVVLRLGGHLEAAGHFPDADAVLRLVEFRHQLAEQSLNALDGLLERGGHLRHGERLLGHVNDGLQNGLQLRVFHGNGRRRVLRSQQFLHGERRLRLGLAGFQAGALRGCFQFFHALSDVIFLDGRDGLIGSEHGVEVIDAASSAISPNRSFCVTTTACIRTISSTARNSAIMARRLRCRSKIRRMKTGLPSPASTKRSLR